MIAGANTQEYRVAMLSVRSVYSGALFMDCPTKKGGHKASTYRQIEQYPDPTRRSYCSGRIRPPAYSRKDQLSI
jgi:hypothetical protein